MIVTVDEVKTHLRIQCDEEDDYLTSLITQAQAAAEDYCRTQFSDPAPICDGFFPPPPRSLCGWRFCSWWVSTMRIGLFLT